MTFQKIINNFSVLHNYLYQHIDVIELIPNWYKTAAANNENIFVKFDIKRPTIETVNSL